MCFRHHINFVLSGPPESSSAKQLSFFCVNQKWFPCKYILNEFIGEAT